MCPLLVLCILLFFVQQAILTMVFWIIMEYLEISTHHLFAPSISYFLLRYMSSLIIQCSTSIHTGDVELVFGSSCWRISFFDSFWPRKKVHPPSLQLFYCVYPCTICRKYCRVLCYVSRTAQWRCLAALPPSGVGNRTFLNLRGYTYFLY